MKIPGRPTVGSETIDGHTYSTQMHEFAVFPQKTGKITIPSIPVRFGVGGTGGADAVEHQVRTPEFHFDAKMPPGAENLDMVVATINLSIMDKWDPVPGNAKVGDAFVRTVAIRAADIPGMALWPMPRVDVPGIGIYMDKPSVKDSFERGDFTGERVETVTYVCKQVGEFTIKGVTFHWWDIDAEEMKTIELEEVVLKVASAPVSETDGFGWKTFLPARYSGLWITTAVLSIILLGVLFKNRYRLKQVWKSWNSRKTMTEPAIFSSFVRACRSNDPISTYNELMRWLNILTPDDMTPTIEKFLEKNPDAKMVEALENLERSVVLNEKKWDGFELSVILKKHRRTLICPWRVKFGKDSLPPLNFSIR
jgi:hypothetical protein